MRPCHYLFQRWSVGTTTQLAAPAVCQIRSRAYDVAVLLLTPTRTPRKGVNVIELHLIGHGGSWLLLHVSIYFTPSSDFGNLGLFAGHPTTMKSAWWVPAVFRPLLVALPRAQLSSQHLGTMYCMAVVHAKRAIAPGGRVINHASVASAPKRP